jgi:predicted metal-dependent enzyme (double-stranded beta helix superfamily)
MPAYAIDAFVEDLKAITAEHTDEREVLRRVTPLAARLAEDTGWVQPGYYGGSEEQGFGVTILYEGADSEILVETVCWLPGRGVTPHDHKTWGVVVGLDGVETNTNWRRKDDGAKPGYADLEERNDVTLKRGQTCTFMPDDIHSVRNDGDTPALSLHVYGRSLSQTGRFEFDPAAKTVKPCPTRERSKG